jgi:TPR repeat protein
MMTARALVVAVAMAVSGMSAAADPTYNLGVDAWRKKDYAEAARQWSLSVLTGDLDAINNLAYLYANGMGVTQNADAADKLWRLAAFSGHAESQWHLAISYEKGLGVPQDLVAAYAWYGCAIESAKRLAPADASGTEAKIGGDAQASFRAIKDKLDQSRLARAELLRALLVQRYGIAAP